eukprot:2965139-Amphidinium_carterae.1
MYVTPSVGCCICLRVGSVCASTQKQSLPSIEHLRSAPRHSLGVVLVLEGLQHRELLSRWRVRLNSQHKTGKNNIWVTFLVFPGIPTIASYYREEKRHGNFNRNLNTSIEVELDISGKEAVYALLYLGPLWHARNV